MKLKLKLDGDGHVVLQDGKPVYVYEDGREAPFDASAAMEKISQLNDENASRRHENSKLKETLEKFKLDPQGEEFIDPEAAKKALETVKNLSDKDLYDAAQVEKLKADMNRAYAEKEELLKKQHQRQLSEVQELVEKKDGTIYNLMVRSKFAESPTILDKTNLPPDIAADYFGKHFVVEGEGADARVVGKLDGDVILSRERPGNPASFEEALSVILDRYPMKDRIMKAAEGGAGAKGSGDDKGGKGKYDVDLAKLPPTERLKYIHRQEGGQTS